MDLDREPVWVDGDAARLQQIQINLLSNAVKYTPSGGHARLHVGSEADGAVIRVSDDGSGIEPHLLESVFDLFVQGVRTLDHAGGGLGVGLTLVRAIVEMHGGTVTAHSDGDGAGSEFVVRLALARPAAESDRRREAPLPVQAPPPITVLVVEDNADSREMLCALLTAAGLDCHNAPDGGVALRMLDEISPDVVILDVGLPGLSGLEVARRIRANPRHRAVRLIALTGYGQATDRAATREAGFDDHLVKPVPPALLFATLAGTTPSATTAT